MRVVSFLKHPNNGFKQFLRIYCSYPEVTRRISHTKDEYLKLLTLLPKENIEDPKVLKVSIIGSPNSGKSSLVNMLANWNACAVSGKVNTTRSKQTVLYTQNNIQLCFLDLPGLLSHKQKYRFKLEKSLIRDPHSGIFESDLILVLIDVTHMSSRKEIPMEIMKALHYFDDKPSILVLNKIDRTRNVEQLYEITRNLTNGIVGNQISHIDKYANRFRKQIPTIFEILEDPRMNKLLSRHSQNQLTNGDTKELLINETIDNELKSLNDCLKKDSAENEEFIIKNDNENDIESKLQRIFDVNNDNLDKELSEPIIDVIKKQMMLSNVSKDELLKRRKKWWDVTRKLEITKEFKWTKFDETFGVSCTTGKGIEKLRDYLLSQAKPGRWYFHSSIVTKVEPEKFVEISIRAQCLNVLEDEIPYGLHINVKEYDKATDGTIQILANIECSNSRELKAVIGTRGENIKKISDISQKFMEESFKTKVSMKVVVTMKGVNTTFKKAMQKVTHTDHLRPKGFDKI